MVGMLAALGATMSALVGLAHGVLVGLVVAAAAGVATGLAAYAALPSAEKKITVPLSKRYIPRDVLLPNPS
jgi:hypothetical protein